MASSRRDIVAERVLVPAGTTCGEAVTAAKLPAAGPNAVVVVRTLDGTLKDLGWAPDTDTEVEPVTLSSPDGLDVMRHSAAHVLAQAVQDLYPEAKLGIGPPVEDGFYYDFDVPTPFQADDLKRVEDRMREIVKAGQRFQRRAFPSLEAARAELADEPFKLELIDIKGEVGPGEVMEVGGGDLTIYDNVDQRSGQVCWSDVPRSASPSTRLISAIKLTRNAAAYWRGDEKNPQLQRIYGTAWPTRDQLKDYLRRLEEAAKRDHRRIGEDLELFTFSTEVGKGRRLAAQRHDHPGRVGGMGLAGRSAVSDTSGSSLRTSLRTPCTTYPGTCPTTPTTCTRRSTLRASSTTCGQ